MAREVVIHINFDGTTQLEANGFKGKECTKATEGLVMMLSGGGDSDTKPKPDYYAQNSSSNYDRN